MFIKIFKLKMKLWITEVRLLYLKYIKTVILAIVDVIVDIYNSKNDRR